MPGEWNTRSKRKKSTPLLAEVFQSGLFQIVRGHCDPKFNVGLKCEEPRLSQRRNLGRVGQIDHEHCSSSTVLLCEIDRFWFDRLQDTIQLGACCPVLHGGVECLMWDFDVQ